MKKLFVMGMVLIFASVCFVLGVHYNAQADYYEEPTTEQILNEFVDEEYGEDYHYYTVITDKPEFDKNITFEVLDEKGNLIAIRSINVDLYR